MQAIFDGAKVFDTPKPIELLFNLFRIATDKNAIILDAFGGSGTTAHSVIDLNRADGGERHFIVIESQPYAETLIAERVRRVDPECNFGWYELGARLFLDNDRQYLLGIHDGRAIYFLYDPDRKLSIDDEFVFSTLDDGAEERVIYAARTFCGERFLQRYNVEFRRIPSGIIRY